jgi:hypothetical protein
MGIISHLPVFMCNVITHSCKSRLIRLLLSLITSLFHLLSILLCTWSTEGMGEVFLLSSERELAAYHDSTGLMIANISGVFLQHFGRTQESQCSQHEVLGSFKSGIGLH